MITSKKNEMAQKDRADHYFSMVRKKMNPERTSSIMTIIM